MNYTEIILAAAKSAKVSGSLLLAICSYESHDFQWTFVQYDHGSPSVGICMVKEETAKMLGFTGNLMDLMDSKVNAKYAAKYLKFQEERYGSKDWCKLVSSYNAGTYKESKKQPGKPTNLVYVRRVQKKLDKNLQHRLSCE